MAGAAFGSCLKGWGVVARAAVGPNLAWQAQHFGDASAEVVAGGVRRAPGLARMQKKGIWLLLTVYVRLLLQPAILNRCKCGATS